MSWAWEYEPGEQYVVGGENPAPEALVTQVEEKAGELVRAAEARYLDGTAFQGVGEGTKMATVANGLFLYLVVPRHERVYILQVTAF
ncbi:hypothetical protein [Actinacidiphila sp. bgisy167]|uniref:hypothetical protein n=1 Tax=Actinacidiphila sp. bgisy167 TaxID=3413797 RepID=UPI003D71709C